MFSFIKKLYGFFRKPELSGKDFEDFEEDAIYKTLSADEDWEKLLRFYIFRDKERYFKAPDDRTRNIIRGQIIRTYYIIRKIRENKKQKVGSEVQKTVGRYGV